MPVRLVIIGGFLGSGKTTAILRLVEWHRERGRRVGILTNDHAADLVDTRIFRACGLTTSEITGAAFCCRFDEFIAGAEEISVAEGSDVIIAEPVGSAMDLVSTLLNPVERFHPGTFRVAPFTVLADAVTTLNILEDTESPRLSERVRYILEMQQQEADAIALNKMDALTAAGRDRVERAVRDRFPGTRMFSLSARTGEGFDEWLSWLESADHLRKPVPEIDYDTYAAGEADLGVLNTAIVLEAPEPVALDDALGSLGQELHEALASGRIEVAHGKVLLQAGRQLAVLHMLGAGRSPELSRRSAAASRHAELLVNLRVQADPIDIEAAIRHRLHEWIDRYGFTIVSGSGVTLRPPRPVPQHRFP